MGHPRVIIALFAAALAATDLAQSPPVVVLVTLDGARTAEVFGGLDVAIVQAGLKPDQRLEDHPLYRRFWVQ